MTSVQTKEQNDARLANLEKARQARQIQLMVQRELKKTTMKESEKNMKEPIVEDATVSLIPLSMSSEGDIIGEEKKFANSADYHEKKSHEKPKRVRFEDEPTRLKGGIGDVDFPSSSSKRLRTREGYKKLAKQERRDTREYDSEDDREDVGGIQGEDSIAKQMARAGLSLLVTIAVSALFKYLFPVHTGSSNYNPNNNSGISPFMGQSTRVESNNRVADKFINNQSIFHESVE
jgi:hypothetical protein